MLRAALLVLLALLLVWLVADLSEKSVDHDGSTVRVVATWGRETPPYVVDEQMFTPTTTARARTAPTVRTANASSAVVVGETTINGYPCGGGVYPPCWRIRIESGGDFTAVNPTGCGGRTCGGRAQWDPVTWIPGCTVSKWNHPEKYGACGDYKGYRFAQDAPPDIQMEREREVWDGGRGCNHWSAC